MSGSDIEKKSSDGEAAFTKEGQQDNSSVSDAAAPTSSDDSPEAQKATTDAAESTAPTRSRLRIVLLMTSLGLAVFLAALDQIIVATALPVIARELKASSSAYAWIASAYLIANASSIPIWGRISDIFGRKPSILAANALFMIGSLVSALADTLTMLIVGRAIQGIIAQIEAIVELADSNLRRRRRRRASCIGEHLHQRHLQSTVSRMLAFCSSIY